MTCCTASANGPFAIAAELGNVRAACRAMGTHPSTDCRWKR
jgi:hypothetical protein